MTGRGEVIEHAEAERIRFVVFAQSPVDEHDRQVGPALPKRPDQQLETRGKTARVEDENMAAVNDRSSSQPRRIRDQTNVVVRPERIEQRRIGRDGRTGETHVHDPSSHGWNHVHLQKRLR